jgi:hypothetical protein
MVLARVSLETVVRPSLPVDLRLTLRGLRHGARDPAVSPAPDGWWRATRTPEGPATVRFASHGDRIGVTAWGPGAAWAIEAAPDALGSRDGVEGFDPPHGLVRDLHRRMAGLRIPRTKQVFEAIVPTIVEQKVTGREAFDSYRSMVRAWGEPAPGPGLEMGLIVPPAPVDLARRSYFEFHPFGIERRRACTVQAAASGAPRLEETVSMSPAAASERMRALPGVGPWTAAEVALVALGDADAVPVGDYHLPHTVSWSLAGEPRGSDERMLELLQPFAGHRGRVLRLLVAAGLGAPRFGPRMPLRSFRSS